MIMNIAMFIFCVIVWGSSYWFAKKQAIFAPAEFSLLIRQIVALVFFCILYLLNYKKYRLKISQYVDIGIFAICNFMLGYWLLYISTGYLSSGVVVVIFSFKSILTPILLSLKNKETVKTSILVGAFIAIVGIFILVYDSLSFNDSANFGLLYAFIGTLMTSTGDMYSAKNSKNKIHPIYANLIGLLIIVPIMLIVNINNATYLARLSDFNYLFSIFYLGVVASGLAWLFYLKLIKNIGAVYSSYMVTLFPIVGCIVSILFEHMEFTSNIAIGMILETLGLLVVFMGEKIVKLCWRVFE